MLTPKDRWQIFDLRERLARTDEREVYLRLASDVLPANYDEFSRAGVDVSADDLTFSYTRWTAKARVEWTTGRRYHPLASGGIIRGDCLLYIRPEQERSFARLMEHPASHVLVDGQKLRVIGMTPVNVGATNHEVIVECKRFTPEDS